METDATARDAGPRIDEHFDHIRANLIRCEECDENFFFDFLRHPRYFVTHFKTCHLKNVLYRFNGCSEEENQRVRFGPRRKKDAKAWFGQLKSTEKRMISMQDNKWGEIAERECWSCRLCKQARKSGEIPHAFEPNELGRRQALLHLRQFHEAAYNSFLSMLPAVDSSLSRGNLTSHNTASLSPAGYLQQAGEISIESVSIATTPRHSIEAERSRLRRMNATPEAKRAEAERSRRRREQLTPAQRQADAERRARKRQRAEERARSRLRRAEASPDAREREMKRSRERRLNATEQQRKREAQRSRMRRQNATQEQKLRERERCRRRYEIQKQQRLVQQATSVSALEVQPATPVTPVSDATSPPASVTSDQNTPPRARVLPADLERRNQQLLQQQAGLGQQLRSLYASLSLASRVEL
ncbi:hypothetical protein F442_15147 [Phytophthora nicotianae P10297]|uniref:Uncharacterized protein n=6 Tax=Phytophthora nicotianae TaxID=4792 RepID=W2R0K2_PHYN3|nr:hypothetical protein PPTG_04403 [Phytophthora nicotianae INRA-310]ETL85967.1 hypothetical protein L917_14569 [Phytophthora nicotianae]ETN18967.1 hypothetical protein PPTG_04403 [Phytophthora nicotianae INRA-310]ETP36995.1 hypothetical protein F442_15147 [Phytophthora nicotianae P10297]